MVGKYTDEFSEESVLDEMTPTDAMPKCRVVLLNSSIFAINAIGIIPVLVAPAHIEAMVGSAHKGSVLGGMVAGATVLMFLLGPPVGVLSDRMVSPLGKRRPIIIASTVFICVSLLGLACSAPPLKIKESLTSNTTECYVDLAVQRCHPYGNGSEHGHPQEWQAIQEESTNVNIQTLALYVFCYLMTIGSLLCYTVPYNALIADMSRHEDRGFTSGVMGFMAVTGDIASALLGVFFTDIGIYALCGCLIAIFIVCTAVTVLSVTEIAGKQMHEPLEWKEIICSFWAPLTEHDFKWVFITRFIMMQGVFTILNFLEYWLEDMVDLPYCLKSPRTAGLLLMTVFTTAAVGSVVCGILSDHLVKRKVFVVVSSAVLFGVAVAMGSVEGDEAFTVAVVGCLIFGLALGAYTSVEFALVMDVLPANKDKAKDLAVWYQALALPQAFATPVGGFVLDVFERVDCKMGLGYILLFVISGLCFLLSGIFVTKIRNAR